MQPTFSGRARGRRERQGRRLLRGVFRPIPIASSTFTKQAGGQGCALGRDGFREEKRGARCDAARIGRDASVLPRRSIPRVHAAYCGENCRRADPCLRPRARVVKTKFFFHLLVSLFANPSACTSLLSASTAVGDLP